eukprot:jgi/Chlat1/7681/Chrsp64S07138
MINDQLLNQTTKRAGWGRCDIALPESIADHMYRMAMMGLVLSPDADVNRERCIQLALVHDLAEAIVGDITPHDGVEKEDKSRLEAQAMQEINKMLGPGFAGPFVEELWKEYEEGITPEAQLVKDFDKLEMILQAAEYEQAQGRDLSEFFTSTSGRFTTKLGQKLAAEIVHRRSEAKLNTTGSSKV